eukprot:2628087-Pleurochrysis_carterae.AAC.1
MCDHFLRAQLCSLGEVSAQRSSLRNLRNPTLLCRVSCFVSLDSVSFISIAGAQLSVQSGPLWSSLPCGADGAHTELVCIGQQARRAPSPPFEICEIVLQTERARETACDPGAAMTISTENRLLTVALNGP